MPSCSPPYSLAVVVATRSSSENKGQGIHPVDHKQHYCFCCRVLVGVRREEGRGPERKGRDERGGEEEVEGA